MGKDDTTVDQMGIHMRLRKSRPPGNRLKFDITKYPLIDQEETTMSTCTDVAVLVHPDHPAIVGFVKEIIDEYKFCNLSSDQLSHMWSFEQPIPIFRDYLIIIQDTERKKTINLNNFINFRADKLIVIYMSDIIQPEHTVMDLQKMFEGFRIYDFIKIRDLSKPTKSPIEKVDPKDIKKMLIVVNKDGKIDRIESPDIGHIDVLIADESAQNIVMRIPQNIAISCAPAKVYKPSIRKMEREEFDELNSFYLVMIKNARINHDDQ